MDNSKVVFISHSSADNNISEQMYNALESRGVGCWMDRFDIVPGIPYARAIMNGIEKCDAFVVLLSSSSVRSDDVLNEIDNAHALKKQLIPVFLEEVELPKDFSYYLNRWQWITYKHDFDSLVKEICCALDVDCNEPCITDCERRFPMTEKPRKSIKKAFQNRWEYVKEKGWDKQVVNVANHFVENHYGVSLANTCQHCGTVNKKSAKYCSKCGRKII